MVSAAVFLEAGGSPGRRDGKQIPCAADRKGLGKTIQTISFLASLYYSGKLKKPSLIVCPATLTQQWVQEFHAWWPPLRIINLHASSGKHRTQKGSRMRGYAEQFFGQKGAPGTIFIASYEGIASYGASFARLNWRCVVLDEGHKISNPDTKVSQAAKQFLVRVSSPLTPRHRTATSYRAPPSRTSSGSCGPFMTLFAPGSLGYVSCYGHS